MSDIVLDAPLGTRLTSGGVSFSIWAPKAKSLTLCVFDENDVETQRIDMDKDSEGYWHAHIAGAEAGLRYGYRADGQYDPDNGSWFDPSKLLLDPYATHIDRGFKYHQGLGAARSENIDTARLVPKSVVQNPYREADRSHEKFQNGGLIYELQVRSFTKLHPDIPENIRGTIAALGHPAIIQHLKKIGVDAVELMPITAWISERHLAPLGLSNGWGYNPVSYFALDPTLAPSGLNELKEAVASLHEAGIGVFQDVVFNHNGESDVEGTTLSFRGLDNEAYFRNHTGEPGKLINDTGCGNSVDCNHPIVRRLILDSMRHFVKYAGIDGYRFDLGPALGRDDKNGGAFSAQATLLQEMLADELLKDCVLIAEPWDIGPGGYQLGKFPERFLEWNDGYRDDTRRFWRGDNSTLGDFVTRLCGSADIFQSTDLGAKKDTRTVNFLAAHDGFTLRDLVSYEDKHNHANGENNRDGHNDNISWNNGHEGEIDNTDIQASRRRDLKALLSSLFLSRGSIMLTAGDEFGRTQSGNNNAYAQDNETTWLDWSNRDKRLEQHVAGLATIRRKLGWNTATHFFENDEVEWRRFDGEFMTIADWEQPDLGAFVMEIPQKGVIILFNRTDRHQTFIRDGSTQTINPRTVNVILLNTLR